MGHLAAYKAYLDQGRRIFTDSRKVIPDGVFVALKGPSFDGNQYALEALDKGAAFAVVDRIDVEDPRLILVPDTLQALQDMGRRNRQNTSATIIAITGSNGKTTTKEIAHSIFSRAFKTLATSGNLNNHIGVPLTLLGIDEETEFAIVEMGANKPGDIHELCTIAQPDAGLITSIGRAHLEGFGSPEGVVRTKLELFDFLALENKPRFYNLNADPIRDWYKGEFNQICFGDAGSACRFTGRLLRYFPDIEMEFYTDHESVVIESVLFGNFNYQNILAAASMAAYYGVSKEQIQQGVASYVPGNMRSQILQYRHSTVVLDAYNANPSSMKEAIGIFTQMPYQDKWVILGEMAELGDFSESEHRELVSLVRSQAFQTRIFVGPAYRECSGQEGIRYFETMEACKSWLETHWPPGGAVLIKGSRASGLEALIR